MSPASPLASSLGLHPAHQRKPSINSQSSTDSTSSYVRSPSDSTWSPPGSGKTTPEGSVESSSQDGGSKSSSRTSSSDFTPTVSDQSNSQINEPISYAVTEIDGAEFHYLKIPLNLVPAGWSNDPCRLRAMPRKSLYYDYLLQGPLSPLLVSDSDHGAPRVMIFNYSKLYFWTPGSDELLYVTELYSLTKILRRMDEGFCGIRTKPLKPLHQHFTPDEPLYHSLWFWQVPEGWSQDICELRYLQEVMSGCYEYGLPLSVPILVSDGRSGSADFFLKCGEEYYLFYEISTDLVHIDEPTALKDILRVIGIHRVRGSERYPGLKTTRVNPLPEFGGPHFVADNDVPEGWTNKINKEVSCGQIFYEHGILGSTLLLFKKSSLNGTSLYLVEAEQYEYYIWNPASNEVSHINEAEGLQDILDILKDLSRQLLLTRVEGGRHSKVTEDQ